MTSKPEPTPKARRLVWRETPTAPFGEWVDLDALDEADESQPVSRTEPRGVGLGGEDTPAVDVETRAMQARLLNEPDHEALVVVEYVDAELGIGEAREVASGQPVSLSHGRTRGLTLENLRVGTKLIASITRFQHATTVQLVTR